MINSNIKSIILAAGQGSRLRPLTDKYPKGMVELNGVSLIQRQIDIIKKNDIDSINIVTGYKFEKINFPNIKTYFNPDYEITNMVESLYAARDIFDGENDIIISYSDIIYEERVLKSLLSSDDNISIVIDKSWKKLWDLRMDDVLSDVESLKLDNDMNVLEIGKPVKSLSEIEGQYIGLIKIKKEFARYFFKFYEEERNDNNRTNEVKNIYMTDYLQLLINKSIKVKAVPIKNGWLEVDTLSDLDVYKGLINSNNISLICDV